MNTRRELVDIFSEITDPDEMDDFFQEIFTEKELRDLVLRWQLLKELHEGKTQRNIAATHGISLCKITRGAKILKQENSAARRLLEKHSGRKDTE
ncbi:transcriptional regulator [Desulfonema ishimotonii]|uniref:Transcriptional regulator n=1 Tax=Desulfonema ishimotonii TaxID=45657 RepID=A0A401FTN7_9BACT|nr:Trp family transcriptional regulator [Desulfonema ishimotonii]GBC60329.1 transcriptional regulator [Desulfonema ishimotonii]